MSVQLTTFQSMVKATYHLFSSVDGCSKIAKLATNVFSMVEYGCGKLPTSIIGLNSHLLFLIDFSCIVKCLKLFKNCVISSEAEKRYDRPKDKLNSLISHSRNIVTIATLMRMLEKTKCIDVGWFWDSISGFTKILMTASSICELWLSFKTLSAKKIALTEATKQFNEINAKMVQFEGLRAKKKIKKVHQYAQTVIRELKNNPVLDQDLTKIKQYAALAKCKDIKVINKFCKDIVDQKKAQQVNARLELQRSLVVIALCVSGIALGVFTAVSFVFSVSTTAFVLGSKCALSISDLAFFHVTQYLTPVEVVDPLSHITPK